MLSLPFCSTTPSGFLKSSLAILILFAGLGCSSTDESVFPGSTLTVEEPVARPARNFRVKPMFEDVVPSRRETSQWDADVQDSALRESDGQGTPRAAVYRDAPSVQVTRLGPRTTTSRPRSNPGAGDDRDALLRQLLDEVLLQLEPYENQADEDLTLADRLRKYKLQKKLIGLHQWLPHDMEPLYLDRLLRSLERPTDPPSKSHALMVASLYHDIDREDLRDAMLKRIRVATTAAPTSTVRETGFEIKNFQLCSQVRDFKDYTPVASGSLKGGRRRTLYGELVGLASRHDERSDTYSSSIEATLHFYRGTTEERRVRLSAIGGDVHRSEKAMESNFFAYPFVVPVGLEGQYRIVVRIRDVYADEQVEAEQSLRMRK